MIHRYVSLYKLRNNLEIGSWDGAGSTRCFVDAQQALDGPKRLICVEALKDRYDVLVDRYKDVDWVDCRHCTSLSYDQLIYKDFEDIWTSPYNKISGYSKALVKSWFDNGVELIKNSVSLQLETLGPFDSVLLDGCEFSGYSEFVLLKDKTNVFFLDDVHSAFKCYQVYEELKNNTDWVLTAENASTRNGYAIFVRRHLHLCNATL